MASTPTEPPQLHLPDLVRDSKIETDLLGEAFRHFFYESGRSARERFIRREERWVRVRELGRGAYGVVYLEKCAQGCEAKRSLRAVKELKKFVTRGQELDYMMELEAIVKFSNSKYAHCFVRSDGWFELGDSIFITMEYLELGDLQLHLDKALPEYEARLIACQTLEGLGFMHDNGFVHRDLKPGNIMVVVAGPDWFVKIGDFGISKRRREDVTSLQTNLQRGTLGYAAPEALGCGADNAITSYTSTVDIWSLGAVTYMMLTNSLVFPNVADMVLFANGLRTFPSRPLLEMGVSDEAQTFITKLLTPDPKLRPSAKMAMTSPWWALALETASPVGDPIDSDDSPTPAKAQQIVKTDASKAWSTESMTNFVPFQNLTLRHLRRSSYRQPWVEDFHEESESDPQPCLPSDSIVLMVPMWSSDSDRRSWPYAPSETSSPGGATEEYSPRCGQVKLKAEDTTGCHSDSDQPPESLTTAEQFPPTQLGSREHIDHVPNADRKESSGVSDKHAHPHFARARSQDVDSLDYSDGYYDDSNLSDDSDPMTDLSDDGFEPPAGQGSRDLTRPLPTSILAFCDICHCRTITADTPAEFLCCGHYLCRDCLFQLLILSLVGPKRPPLDCCEEVDLWKHPAVQARVTKDRALRKLMDAVHKFRTGTWKCPRGHGPASGSLSATITRVPVWDPVTTCSGCLTWPACGATADFEKLEGEPRCYSTRFCVFCKEEVDLEATACWCGWDVPITRLAAGMCGSGKLPDQVLDAHRTIRRLLSGERIACRDWDIDTIANQDSDELPGQSNPSTPTDGAYRNPLTPMDGDTWNPFAPTDGGYLNPFTSMGGTYLNSFASTDETWLNPFASTDGAYRDPFTPSGKKGFSSFGPSTVHTFGSRAQDLNQRGLFSKVGDGHDPKRREPHVVEFEESKAHRDFKPRAYDDEGPIAPDAAF